MAPSAITTESFPAITSFPSKHDIKITNSISVVPTQPQTVDELIRQLAQQSSGNEPIISYPSSGIDYVNYTPAQLDTFAFRVAQKYKSTIPQRTNSSEPESVIGLLGPSNFDYFVTLIALTKLGHTVLFLSTRISNPAYVSLLQATGAKHLLIEESFRDTVIAVKNSFPSLQIHEIAGTDTYDFPITDVVNTALCEHLQPDLESGKIAWIIHSSGSTGLPKPIYQTHKAALNNYASNLNLRGFITLPLFHAHGISSVFRALHSRKQIWMHSANLPLTQQSLLAVIRGHPIEILYGVPYALKLLGDSPEGIAALANLKVVMFGGSACPKGLGDKLVENGVNLVSHYGT